MHSFAPRKYSRLGRVRSSALPILLICSLARLRFFRHRRRLPHSLSRRSGAVSSPSSTPKQKDTVWCPFVLAEKERFELSRRYSRPTPLAGAPLRPLEYFSVYSSRPPLALACDNLYYTQVFLVCQALFVISINFFVQPDHSPFFAYPIAFFRILRYNSK